ncbi:hypothetical protein EMCRGX_G018482 [Ephydatia muelleri]
MYLLILTPPTSLDNKNRMACGIILCGASSIGKSTLAQEWCTKHVEYARIEEVARDIMKSSNLTRDDLTASIQTDKRVFLDLQLQIMEEQNRRESELAGRPFVSDRGPDPIVYAAMHADQASADRLCAHEAAAACFQRYRTECMVVILCPLPSTVDDGFRLVESREKQDQFNNCLRTLLDQHRIPYLYLGIIDREKRMRALESMLRGTLGVHIEESIKVYPCPLSVAFRASCFTPHSLSPCRTALCRLDVSCESIKISLPAPSDGKTNRMAHRYGAEKMIVVSFDRKVSPRVVKHVIDGGVWVNGTVFHFLGCSSSGLKSRTCYMFQGSKGEIERMLAECFVMKKDTPTSKRMKRIGMLFSELKLTSVVVVDKDVIEMLDIERNGFNFTDGCGGISKDLAEKVKEGVGIVEAYLPSVYQIRYQGCKGVVVLDPKLASGKLMIRPSMKKCLSGSKPFLEIGICDYSRPYSYGHLNRQFIMLFSALGIKDEVFIKKQEAHLARLEKLAEDPEVTVQMLYWRNMPELARKVVECQGMLGESKSLKRELMSLQSKLFDKLDRLQIFIPESRCIFGVCDPLGILSYGQCFVRITIAGKPATVVGQVTVAKNPCYLLGDVRVLMAVDEPRLNHLVDCIVFPTRGQRPHPTEMAGSDLDGDQYFVCWDNDLIVPTLREPYTYPEMSGAEDVGSMIDYFAKQQSNMGLIDTYYKFWADYKGIQSAECQGLGKLFSRSVDATKTGDYVNVPKPFLPPKEEFQMWRENHVALCGTSMKVWQILDQKATELYQKRQNSTILNSLQTNMATIISEDFVWHAICNEQRGVSEYQLFLFILQWIDAQQFSCDESAEKLKAFSMHIDFGKFTVDEQKAAVDKGIPLGLVTNALNSSQLLSNTMLQHFLLDVPHLEWHYYTRSAGADVDWQHLIRAVRDFPESLFIFQLFDEAFVCLHFMCSLPTGDNIPLKPGSIASYLFSPHFEYYQRHVLVGNYFISLDDNVLQIYRNGEKRQSFLWLANIHELRKENATMFDRISVDLTQFKGARPKHPLINKQQISYFEVFVKSSNPADAYFDLYEAVQPDIELPMEICSIEDIEELPDDVVESSETGMLSVTVESARSGLDTYAMNGHASQFRAALEVLISVDHALDSTVVTKLFCTLMETLVSKYIHLVRLPNGIIEDLQVILSTMFEHQCFRSAQASIQVMTYLSQLHPTGLAEQFLSSFLHSMQLSQYSEYVDCVCSWKLWCCFPQDIALQLASKIHDLSKSFVTSKGDKPQEAHDHFNLSQLEAIRSSLSNRLTLIQGPPGTGKTHVACEIICKQNAKQPDKHILAVAETNMAVDNMTARLQKMGLRVVRVGSEAKISPSIRHLTIEYQVELKQKEEGKRPRRATFPSPRLAKQVLKAAQVVTTTCTGAGDPILDGMQFPFVLIDEATQATELATLIPIVHQCDQLTLIGDPEQLSPNILFGGNNRTDCSVTSVEQLKTTLFHRLQGKVPFHFLNEQHRMHPALCEFPSLQFYSGQLKTAHTPYTYDSIDFYWPDKSRPLLFIDTNSREISNKRSFANEKEANVITDVVKCLLNLKLSPLEIVVLTPYLAQVECIHSKLCEEVVGVEVCTVDSFQGREKDVVIFSTVRCNPGGSVGFVDDRYRMNVLLTRAKRGIIGVGNKTTLCTGSSLWQSWLQFVPCITDKDFYAKMNTRKQCTGNTTPAKGARPFQHERRAKQKKLQRYDAK